MGEWCAEKGIKEVDSPSFEFVGVFRREYPLSGRSARDRVFRVGNAPAKKSSLPHVDWVSSIICQLQGYVYHLLYEDVYQNGLPRHFLTASYDGNVRLSDYSQKLSQSVLPTLVLKPDVCIAGQGFG